jgi:hypothetical protein
MNEHTPIEIDGILQPYNFTSILLQTQFDATNIPYQTSTDVFEFSVS